MPFKTLFLKLNQHMISVNEDNLEIYQGLEFILNKIPQKLICKQITSVWPRFFYFFNMKNWYKLYHVLNGCIQGWRQNIYTMSTIVSGNTPQARTLTTNWMLKIRFEPARLQIARQREYLRRFLYFNLFFLYNFLS